jgi:predicted SnoaL-like aldol condensation-catalyzing enzyme
VRRLPWCGDGPATGDRRRGGYRSSRRAPGRPRIRCEDETTSATPTSATPTADQPDRADRATEDANLAVVTAIFATGPPGLRSGPQAVIARTAADGDLVAVHWHETTDPAQPWTGRAHIDPYRLAGGKVTSHWALAQDVPASGAGGHTVFDDAYPATGAPPGEEGEETQRSFVVGAYDTLFREQDPSVLDRSFDPGYLQHDPLVPDGTASPGRSSPAPVSPRRNRWCPSRTAISSGPSPARGVAEPAGHRRG